MKLQRVATASRLRAFLVAVAMPTALGLGESALALGPVSGPVSGPVAGPGLAATSPPPSTAAQPAGRTDALGPLLAQAQALMSAGQPQVALALLEDRTPAFAGDPDFDFQLGIAALDAGDSGKAIFALERVLAAQPDNTLARAEIARAFLAAQEHDAARREFEVVYAADLPEPVRRTVERYLAILALPEAERKPRLSGHVEVAIGYDDNVNLGTSLDRWVIGDGQALIPLATSRPGKSTFQTVGVFAQYVVPIGGSADWTIGVNLNQRINPSQHNYDLGSVDLTTGFGWVSGKNRYSVSGQMQQIWLDQEAFRAAGGLSAQWQRELGPATQVGVYGQWFALDFPDQELRNARRLVAGLTAVHGFGEKASPVGVANLYVGREKSTEAVDELSFRFLGLRAGLSATLAANWRASTSIGWERRDHDAADSFFGVTREDRQLEWRAGLERDLASQLTLSPVISHLRNTSSLGPNEFRRTQFQLGLRYRY